MRTAAMATGTIPEEYASPEGAVDQQRTLASLFDSRGSGTRLAPGVPFD
jgi:hypothetical protein